MQALIRYFDDLESAWRAKPADLAGAGLSLKLIERIIKARENIDLEKVWAKIESQGIKILTWEDETYPQRLKEIEQPPPVLFDTGPDELIETPEPVHASAARSMQYWSAAQPLHSMRPPFTR